MNTVFAWTPRSSPTMSTCAQAVPSGYLSAPCSFTMRLRRNGTRNSTPRIPPTMPMAVTVVHGSSYPSSRNAGRVKAMPAAIDSPAEPVVCTRLFCRIVAGWTPNARDT